MHIVFKFKYIHNNGLLTHLFKRIITSSPLNLNAYNDGDMFYIESSGEQKELEGFAELISLIVPQSLFLQESSLQEIETLSPMKTLDESKEFIEIPYCIECQNKILQTLNPFEQCEVCSEDKNTLSINDISSIPFGKESNSEVYFTYLAEYLIANKELELLTYDNNNLYYKNSILLDYIYSFEKKNMGQFININICIKKDLKICQDMVFKSN